MGISMGILTPLSLDGKKKSEGQSICEWMITAGTPMLETSKLPSGKLT
jgi:hypothetical protein